MLSRQCLQLFQSTTAYKIDSEHTLDYAEQIIEFEEEELEVVSECHMFSTVICFR